MQTFMSYDSFYRSLHVLDDKRLGKQRVEAKQILNAIKNGWAWANHPAVNMWRGYEDALTCYHNTSLYTWIGRGFKNTMAFLDYDYWFDYPWWMGNEEFHASHRSNLLRKDPVYYGQFGWKEPDNLPYLWPVNETKTFRVIKK